MYMCPDPVMLSAWFDNEVSETDSARIKNHLAECPACCATVEVFAHRREALIADGPTPLAEEDRLDRFWTYVGQNRIQKVSAPRRLSVPIPIAAAAAVVLAFAIIINFVNPRGNTMPSILVVEAPAPAPTVVSLTITPGELDDFFAMLEGSESLGDDGLVVLPAELPVSLFGDPQMVRPASLEGDN